MSYIACNRLFSFVMLLPLAWEASILFFIARYIFTAATRANSLTLKASRHSMQHTPDMNFHPNHTQSELCGLLLSLSILAKTMDVKPNQVLPLLRPDRPPECHPLYVQSQLHQPLLAYTPIPNTITSNYSH